MKILVGKKYVDTNGDVTHVRRIINEQVWGNVVTPDGDPHPDGSRWYRMDGTGISTDADLVGEVVPDVVMYGIYSSVTGSVIRTSYDVSELTPCLNIDARYTVVKLMAVAVVSS